ncbi:MAG: haloacid dehalogenase-like hydrolase [Clostridia bacterium]|nr:haloacid dehalogenase-like hydrolase [Clostridia bacterium]
MKPKRPTIALMYDFDKTLCTKDMQEYTFIPNVGMDAKAFWSEASALAKDNGMDGILAYMLLMIRKAQAADKPITRQSFVSMGKGIELFPGVEGWFERVNAFGREQGVKVEHYIISSGLGEIIEGSSIYRSFTRVFACEFFYDASGVACWPKNVVNYTTKTQFLFRINKGVLDLAEDEALNRYTPEDDRPVPFRNMIYIGDGLTDVPCMKLVKANGGYSIAVYRPRSKSTGQSLLQDDRVNFALPADYSEGGSLEQTVQGIIRKMAAEDALVRQERKQLACAKK